MWAKGRKRGAGQNAHVPLEQRFWARVQKSEGCWLWTGAFDGVGYGKLNHQGCRWGAHRMAYALSKGAIPGGMLVCHHCDVRACCRPEHLFLGTYADNAGDCVKKGRARGGSLPGAKHPSAKMTDDTVREIRRLYAIGRASIRKGRGRYRQVDIAQRLGITRAAVSNVIRGTRWKHV